MFGFPSIIHNFCIK